MKKYILGLMALSIIIAPRFVSAQVDVDPNGSVSSCANLLSTNLRYKARDSSTNGEVSTLQDFLQARGFLSTEPTGYFGLLTQSAVSKFQSSVGISPTGYVGPVTRAKISSLSCNYPALPQPYNPCPAGAVYSIENGKPCNLTSVVISAVEGPQSINVGQQGTWKVSASSINGGNLSYSVRWGDEVQSLYGASSMTIAPYTQQTATFTHTYSYPYSYTPTFTVTNSSGQSVSASLNVKVNSASTCTSSGYDSFTGYRCGCSSTSGWSTTTGESCGATSAPSFSVSNYPTTISSGQTSTITLTTIANASFCDLYLNGRVVGWNGSNNIGSQSVYRADVRPTETATYSAKCFSNGNGTGNSTNQNIVVYVQPVALSITTNSLLRNAKVGVSYTTYIEATGGTDSYSWGLGSSSFPPGLSYSASNCEFSGVCKAWAPITGIPTTPGNYTFTLYLYSGSQQTSKTFTLAVEPAQCSASGYDVSTGLPCGCTTSSGWNYTTGQSCNDSNSSAFINASIKTFMSSARAQAEQYYSSHNNSYAGVCGNIGGILQLTTAAAQVLSPTNYVNTSYNSAFSYSAYGGLNSAVCHDNQDNWAAITSLRAPNAYNAGWCVDSRGTSREATSLAAYIYSCQ